MPWYRYAGVLETGLIITFFVLCFSTVWVYAIPVFIVWAMLTTYTDIRIKQEKEEAEKNKAEEKNSIGKQ